MTAVILLTPQLSQAVDLALAAYLTAPERLDSAGIVLRVAIAVRHLYPRDDGKLYEYDIQWAVQQFVERAHRAMFPAA